MTFDLRYKAPLLSQGQVKKAGPEEEYEEYDFPDLPSQEKVRAAKSKPIFAEDIEEGEYEEVQSKYTFPDNNTLVGLLDGLPRSNDNDLMQSLNLLNDLIKEKNNNVLASRNDLSSFRRNTFLDPMLGTSFGKANIKPGDEKANDFHQNISQLRILENYKKEMQKALNPIPKEEREEVFNEIVQGNTWDNIVEKYGEKYAGKVLQNEFIESWDEKEKYTLEEIKKKEPLHPDRFRFTNAIQEANNPMTFEAVSRKEVADMLKYFSQNNNYTKGDFKKRDQLFIDYATKMAKEKYPEDEQKRQKAKSELFNSYIKFSYFNHHPELSWMDLIYKYNMPLEDALYASEKEGHKAAIKDFNEQTLFGLSVHGQKRFGEMSSERLSELSGIVDSIITAQNVLYRKAHPPTIGGHAGTGMLTHLSMMPGDGVLGGLKNNINISNEFLKQLMKVPEEKSVSGFWGKSGLGFTPITNHLSLGVKELAENMTVLGIANKLKDGKELDVVEREMLMIHAVLGDAIAMDTFKKWAQIGQGVTNMAPYIAMFTITSPLYGIAKIGAKTGTTNLVKKLVSEQLRNKVIKSTAYSYTNRAGKKVITDLPTMAAKNIGRLSGATLQTLAMPQFYLNNIVERLTDDMDVLYDPEASELILHLNNTAKPFWQAVRGGMWQHFSEVVTERAGPYIMSSLSKTGKFALSPLTKTAAGQKIVKGLQKSGDKIRDKINIGEYSKVRLLKDYMRVKGFKTWNETRDHIIQNKMGWHGVFEEYMEEFVNYWMSNAFETGKDGKVKLYDWESHDWSKWLDQQIVTAGTVAVFGGTMGSIQFGTELRIGPNTKLNYRVGEKIHSVKIPNKVFDQIGEHIGKDNIDQNAILKIVNDHVKNNTLDNKQVHALFSLLINETNSQIAKNIVNAQEERKEKREGKEEYAPVELTTQEDMLDEITSIDSKINEEKKFYKEKSSELMKKEAVLTNQIKTKEKKDKKTYEDIQALNKLKRERSHVRGQISSLDKKHNLKMKSYDDARLKEYKEIRETKKSSEENFILATQDYEQRNSSVDNKIKVLREKLSEQNLSKEETQKIQKQITAAKGQKTRLWNEHQKNVVALKKASSMENAQTRNTPRITEEDKNEIENYNKEVTKNFPDLAELGLLETDEFSGQIEPPTLKHLEAQYKKVMDAIESIKNLTLQEYDEVGELINVNIGMERLLDKKAVIEKYLHIEQEHVLIPWEDKLPSEKWDVLAHEMTQGKIEHVYIDYRSPDAFSIKLPDGRKVKGYYNKSMSKEQREKVFNAIQSNEKFSLDFIKKEDWNADDKIVDREGIPYGDKIAVKYKGIDIGSIEITDVWEIQEFGERVAKAKSRVKDAAKNVWEKLKETDKNDDLVRMGAPTPEWLKDPVKAKQLIKAVIELLDALGEYTRYTIEELLKILKQSIKEQTDLPAEFRKTLLMTINQENEAIVRHIIARRLEAAGFKVKVEKKSLSGKIQYESMNTPFWTELEKIEVHLRSYSELWKDISLNTGINRERIEAEFIRFVQSSNWSKVVNEETKNEFLSSKIGDNLILNTILTTIQSVKFNDFVSMLNFYDNIRILQHQQLIIDRNNISITELSTGLRYDEFVESLIRSFKNYEYTFDDKTLTGYDALRQRLKKHEQDRLIRESKIKNILDQKGSLEARNIIRKEQHRNDIGLLSEITNISETIWNSYIENWRTLEKEAIIDPVSQKTQRFETYDDLLSVDTYNVRKDSSGKIIAVYNKMHSNIVLNLLLTVKNSTLEEFSKNINDFFLKGKYYAREDSKQSVFSNIYKLATSYNEPSNYSLSAIDVKGDRIPLMVQYNMILKIADEISFDPRSNRIIDYYKAKGQSMKIVVLNGMINKEKTYPGKNTKEMSITDVMLANIFFFTQGVKSYVGNLGQFGDKHQLYYAEMPKSEMPTEEQIKELKETFTHFDEAVEWLNKKVLLREKGKLSSAIKKYDNKLEDLAKHFVYNHALNMQALLETFNGELDQFNNNLIKIVKRAGSSISPGYRLNRYVIGGIGMTYSHAILDDEIIFNKIEEEICDGVLFVSGEMAAKIAVSMGSIYNKLDLFGGVLSSTKALISFIDKESNTRCLTKGNWLNIDILAAAMPESVYAEIAKLMKENKLDTLSFTSTSKLIEKGRKGRKAFTEKGKLETGFKLNAEDIFERSTEDIFIQQDLRHQADPVESEQLSQLLSNILVLPRAGKVVYALKELQSQMVNNLLNEFESMSNAEMSEEKLAWFKEKLNEDKDKELLDLIKHGATANDPVISKLIRAKIANVVQRKALDFKMMRATTQEIPDIDGQLSEFKLSSDKKHYLLPECAVSDTSTRTHDPRFKGNTQAAINYVKENQEKYKDLIDENGEIMTWEIEEREGIIPGEPVMLTRAPADHPHSHTIARVKFHLPGNFSMLDIESRMQSSSDFDGDMRYITSFYKNKKGNIRIVEDSNTKENISNSIFYNLMLDYIDPANNEYITASINTNAYDDIADKYRDARNTNPFDPRAMYNSRNDNMVGMKLKGILTDINTLYSILSYTRAELKAPEKISIGHEKTVMLNHFVSDKYGAMKMAIVNIQNMAFDNAADPKLEAMGINEHTVMFYIALLTMDKKLDCNLFKSYEEHSQAIYNAMNDLSALFNTELYQTYTYYSRIVYSEASNKTKKSIIEDLKKDLPKFEEEIKVLEKLEDYADALRELNQFIKLTRKIPTDIIEFIIAKQLYKGIISNKGSSYVFELFNTNSFLNNDKTLKTIFASAEKVISLGENIIYNDSIEYSPIVRQIFLKIYHELRKNKKVDPKRMMFFKKEHLKSLTRATNNVVRLFAINPEMTFQQTEEYLTKRLVKLQNEFPNNTFLNSVMVHKQYNKKDPEIILDVNLTHARISIDKISKIQNDFDAIPDDQFKNAMYVYSMQKHSGATSRMRGSLFSLIGLQHRTKTSRLISDKLEEMENTFLVDSVTKYQMMQWILRTSWDSEIRELADIKNQKPDIADITTISFLNFPIDMYILDEIIEAKDPKEYFQIVEEVGWRYAKSKDVTIDLFKNYVQSYTGFEYKGYEGFAKFQKHVSILKQRYIARAQKMFPENNPLSENEVKNMLDNDSLHEALASEDPELLEFITNKLKKEYPTVQFFNSYEDFKVFVEKWGGSMKDISTFAIGHAFKNSAYINPEKARQSTTAHEYTHIYWDAIPDVENGIKNKIREFYENNHPDGDTLFGNALDEIIVTDIGRMVTNRAEIEFHGNLWAKFIQLVKDFWAEVKNSLSLGGKKDFMRIISNHVWNNQEGIFNTPYGGNTKVWNMVLNNNDELSFQKEEHIHLINGEEVVSVTGIVAKTKTTTFDEVKQAMEIAKKEGAEARDITKIRLPEGFIEKEADDLIVKYRTASMRGNIIHSIAEYVFNDSFIPKEFNKHFINEIAMMSIEARIKKVRDAIRQVWPDAKFKSEQQIASPQDRIAGFVDLIIDIGKNNDGNSQLIVIDFKTSEHSLIDEKGNPSEYYKAVHGRRRGIAQSVPLSKEGDYKLQLHLYKEILEQQDDGSGKKNIVIAMYIIPVFLVLTSENKIQNAIISTATRKGESDSWIGDKLKEKGLRDDIGWHEYSPKERIPALAARALLTEIRQTTRKSQKDYDRFRDYLRSFGYYDIAIDELIKAHSNLTFLMGDLSKVSNFDISEMRRSGLIFLKNKWFKLGYKAVQIKTLPFERLFYAAVHDIRPEDLDKNFKVFSMRSKYKKEYFKDVPPGWYQFVMNFEGSPFEQKIPKIVRDAFLEQLTIGATVYLDYTFQMESNIEKTVFYKYSIVEIDNTKRKLVLEDSDGARKVLRLRKNDSVLLEHEGDVPKHVILNNKFIARSYYIKEPIHEEHFVGKKGQEIAFAEDRITKNKGTLVEWNHYKHSLYKVWNFFNQFDTFEKFARWLVEKSLIEDIYEEKLRGGYNEVTEDLRTFIGDVLVEHWIAEGIREENKNELQQFMPLTMQFYYMLSMDPESFFKDFRQSSSPGWTRIFMNPEHMQGDYIPFTMLYQDLAKKIREVTIAKYDNNAIINDLYNHVEPLEEELTVLLHGRRYWITPSEAKRRKYDEKIIQFLKHIIEEHKKYNPDYKLLLHEEDMFYKDIMYYDFEERVPVAMVTLSKKELQDRYGKFARMIEEFLMEQQYDNEIVEVKERIKENGIVKWKNVKIERNGKKEVLKVRFKDIKDEYLKGNMSKEDLKKIFGNKYQRWISRQPYIAQFTRNIGSLYNYYKQQAIKKYNENKSLRTKSLIREKTRRLPSLKQVNPLYASQKYVAAEQRHIDNMIYNYHMKNFLAPSDYIISKYRQFNASSNMINFHDSPIAKYMQTQLENSLFGPGAGYNYDKDYRELIKMLVRWSSLEVMAYSIRIQIFNLGIGYINNLTYEPKAFMTGIVRMFGYDTDKNKIDFDKAVINILKAYKILKRFGLANMVQETKFEELDKYHNKYLKAPIAEKIENYGYLFLELAEKTIQIPLFTGMMNQKEWNSYDNKGLVINPTDQLISVRADELTRRVGYAHGFYGKTQQATASTTPEGHAIFQFKKWMLSLAFKFKRQHHFDRGYLIRSGFIDSYQMAIKLAMLFGVKKSKRMDYIGNKLEEINSDNMPFAMRGLSDFYEIILKQIQKGGHANAKAIWNALPKNDKDNMLRPPIMFIVAAMLYYNWGGDDDPFDTALDKWWKRLMMRFFGDMFYFFERQNLEYFLSNPIAAFRLITNTMKFSNDVILAAQGSSKGFYEDDTIFWWRGMPKYLMSFLRVIPFGAGIRDVFMLSYILKLKSEIATTPLGDFIVINEDGRFETTKELRPTDTVLSRFDLLESYRGRKVKERLTEALEFKSLEMSGMDPDEYYLMKKMLSIIASEKENIRDLNQFVSFMNELQNPDSEISKAFDYAEKHEKDIKKAKRKAERMTTREAKKMVLDMQ